MEKQISAWRPCMALWARTLPAGLDEGLDLSFCHSHFDTKVL